MTRSPQVMLQLLKSTTNFEQPLAAKLPLGKPPRGHLAAKGCPEFIVEFNNYSINVEDPMSLTSFLHGASHVSRRYGS